MSESSPTAGIGCFFTGLFTRINARGALVLACASDEYQALRPYLDRLQITQLVLEFATDRAGTLVAFEDKELGLGVVNPRTEQVETPADIRCAVEKALELYPAERLFLNPDCGFGTFSNRPMNTRDIGLAKVAAMTAAARDLRGR